MCTSQSTTGKWWKCVCVCVSLWSLSCVCIVVWVLEAGDHKSGELKWNEERGVSGENQVEAGGEVRDLCVTLPCHYVIGGVCEAQGRFLTPAGANYHHLSHWHPLGFCLSLSLSFFSAILFLFCTFLPFGHGFAVHCTLSCLALLPSWFH